MNSTEKFALVMDRSSIKASSSTARKSSKHSGGSSGYRNVEQATMLNENVVPRRKRDRTEQTNNELCSVDDAFAYEYLDKRLDREHRAVEHSDGRRKKCKRRRRSASKCSSKVASTAETSQELCNVATAWDTTSSKAMLEKCTSTDDLAQQTDDARNNLLAGRTSKDAASSNSQRDVVGKVEKWFSDSVPYSPTQELEMDEETVSLPSEATGADSCDIASTVLDMYDLDLPTTDHKESVPTLLPDDRKAVPADTLNGWQNPCKDQQEPPRMVTAAGSYQVLQHEAGCKCNSILSEVHFELDVYTCLLVLDVCADQSTKDNVFQLYAEARKVCCKEPYLNEIRHLVRAAIESKRSVLKTGTNVLRKLAKIEWSMFPRHPGLPGVSVAIQDLQDRNPQVPCSVHLPRATHGKC
ncbi:uncharacterized protein LOC135387408 [Ornithodoros turicata]|uniref:uncharacterized protein LOC135387408 n=1 Tax=Ornithodoros turicata TaxID=34597 RepID=UPI0031394303